MSAYTPRATPSATLSPSPSPSPSLPHRSLDPSIFVAPTLQEVDPVTVHQRYYQYLRDNPQDASLIRAGYQTAFELPPLPAPAPIEQEPGERSHKRKPSKMAEPRARVARHKGQMNFSSELRLLLLAYGDPAPHHSYPQEPLPETIRVLDEIVTDFILELCHGAAQVAHHARRQKIKVDDFRFALRRDPNKLGRVQELLRMERELKEARKAFDQNDDQVAKDAGKKGPAATDDADAAAAADTAPPPSATGTAGGKKSKGKGKRAARRESDATEDSSVPMLKKRKTIG
ncbi:Transcription initiation factor TFIID subunit 13 [Penicillium manginii]|uniref:Transcription initiation factor TFIID subunit 13 n=1 Tax=Penicillium manginii TaxID=203109 RepID=UPI002549838A|nr:Transcription initiation factor TFIID subunit 13 [Penicillium manginii]KAJ5741918.1 Transcription initiation factor TFIID subunit 13 [Penicillium manginii]